MNKHTDNSLVFKSVFSKRRGTIHTKRLASACLAGVSVASAAIFTWDNVTSPWSVALNWLGDVAPGSAADNELVFGGTDPSYTATHDLGADFNLNILRLNSAVTTATQTLNASGGSTLSFVASGATNPSLVQQGAGAFNIDIPIVLNAASTFTGTAGSGLVSLFGPVGGGGAVSIAGGSWAFRDNGSTYNGAATISGGAAVELKVEGTGNLGINFAGSGTTGIFGTNNTVTINGGSLRLTTQGTGSLTLGTNRVLAFGTNGGTLTLLNSNPSAPATHAGQIASGDFALTLGNATGNPAVIQFNGGQVGLSSLATPFGGDWSSGGNVLRFRSQTGSGPLRIELTNGAMARAGNGTAGTVNIANPMTISGVPGGDPTSGFTGTPAADGQVDTGVTVTTGRYLLDSSSIVNNSAGLTFENAVQVTVAGAARAFDGNITVAGNGYVSFAGRGTGTVVGTPLGAVGANTANANNALYLGQGGNDTLTVQSGGTAVFDARFRRDQGTSHGVVLNAQALIQAGGTLRILQSLSNNFGGITAATVANTVLQGNIVGQGSTTSDARLDLFLPAETGVFDAFGRLQVDATSNIVVNGTGFGGLRITGFARQNKLFAGGAADPDTTSSKVNAYLTPARMNALTGSGGYLTAAARGETYVLPAAEWAGAVSVGLKVADSNLGGVDVQFDPGKTSWAHNLAVDAGAELSTGASPFTLTAATLNGTGKVSGTGGITIAAGANLAPGLGGIGTLTVGDITIAGALLGDVSSTGVSDLLNVGGALTFDPASAFQVTAGSTFNNSNYTLITYSGALTGTFGSVIGLPLGYTVNYAIPGQVRLVFTPLSFKTWNGAPGTVWSSKPLDANWQGGVSFVDGDVVVLDDTAAGSTTVNVSGLVQPGLVTFNNSTKNYVINAPASGDTIGGSALLTKNGTGSLTLNGSHSYGGGTVLNAGTIILGNNDALPNVGNVSVAAGATLNVNGKSDTIGALSVSGTVTAGSLTVSGLTLEDGAAVAANLAFAGDVTKNGTAAVTLPGTIDLGGPRVFTVAAATTPPGLTLSGVVSNGALVKAGLGELRLAVANSYTGGTTVNAGTLTSGASGAIPDGALTINGGTANLAGFSFVASSLTGTGGTLAMGGGGLAIINAVNGSFAGAITGGGTGITKLGAGVQTLSGASTFTGGILILEGRVNLNGTAAAGAMAGIVTVSSGTGLQSGAAIANNIELAGGILSASGSTNVTSGQLNVTAASTIDLFNRDTNAISDVILLGTLRGSGNINLLASTAQANADGGMGLRIRGTTASDYSGTVNVNQKAKFEIQMATATAPNPFGTGAIVLNAGTSTGAVGGTYSQIQARLVAGSQTYVLGNNVQVVGTGYVNANILGGTDVVAQYGNLQIGGGQIFGASKNDINNRTIEFTTVSLTGGNAEFRAFDAAFSTAAARGGANIRLGVISEMIGGSGIILKSGTGYRNEITGVSTYTGPTRVDEGVLHVGITGSIASSSRIDLASGTKFEVLDFGAAGYAIPAGQTLAGLGDVDGRIVQGGTLAPGVGGIGTLTGDDFTLNGSAPLTFDLSTFDNSSDRLGLIGAFEKGSAGTFQFNFLGTGLDGQTYTLVTFASTTFSASDFSYTGLAAGVAGTFQMTPTELQFVAVPEPRAAFSLLGGLGMLLGLRRFRRRA